MNENDSDFHDKETEEKSVEYIIQVDSKNLSKYVLLPGDPDRVEKIGSIWEDYEIVERFREYKTITGTYDSLEITCRSTGMGGPSAAMGLEGLARRGCDTFIRVGTTGALKEDIDVGDVVIDEAAVRLEGTSKQYVRNEYPAYANYEVLTALIEAAEKLDVDYHVGIAATTDSFFTGQGRQGFKGYRQSWMEDILPDLEKMNVTNLEMEAATLFTLSNLYGLRTGAVCAVVDNYKKKVWKKEGEKMAGKVASEAMKILSDWDKIKEEEGKENFYPSLIK